MITLVSTLQYIFLTLLYVHLSCSKNRSMNAFNSPFKTILKTFCRDKGDNPDPWRDPDPDPVLAQSCRSDWIRNTSVCEMEKNIVLWNRNDLLLIRFRLWKSFGSGSGSASGSRQYLAKIFKEKKIVHNLVISMTEAALIPRKSESHLNFLTFEFHLCWIRIQSGSGSAKAKSCSSCGFPQHWKNI